MAEHAGRRAYSAGFWFVACGFATVMSFGTVPTPLYVLYQARDHLSATTVTLVFAAYAVGVLLSLFLLGHFSDVLGRRVLLPAVYVAVVADLCFLFWSSLPGLIVARVLTGVSVGLIATTATAYLAELHRAARPGEACGGRRWSRPRRIWAVSAWARSSPVRSRISRPVRCNCPTGSIWSCCW
ncbi:MFS transporter [Streptomyces thermocarboxydus]